MIPCIGLTIKFSINFEIKLYQPQTMGHCLTEMAAL